MFGINLNEFSFSVIAVFKILKLDEPIICYPHARTVWLLSSFRPLAEVHALANLADSDIFHAPNLFTVILLRGYGLAHAE